jgi:hypothetical protein
MSIPNLYPDREPKEEGMLTDLNFLNIGEPWPPKIEKARLNRYQDNKYLWQGHHDMVFNDWQRLLRADQLAVLEFVFALPKRLSTLWADLLLGEPPRIMAGEQGSEQQDLVDKIVKDNELITVAYEVMIDTSRYGDGLFKLRKEDGKVVIEGQPPALWYPVASRDNVRIITAHVLAWTFDVTTLDGHGRKTKTTYLRVEIHTKGQIENKVFTIEKGMHGKTIEKPVDLAEWAPGRLPIEKTGIDDFLIIPVAGLRTTDEYHGMDDYSDLATLLLEIETRFGQISRILDKHADPSMFGDADAIEKDPNTGEVVFRAGGKFFPSVDGGTPPGYITWDGQLVAAFTELEKLIEMFYLVSETSPAAFGQMNAGLATSGSALRRLMMAPLAKVNRIRLRLDPSLKKLLTLAAELGGSTPPESIDIHWRDGLPEDPSEQATIEGARKLAGNTSLYSSLRRLDGGTDSEIQDEIDRIHEDNASNAGTMGGLPNLKLRFGGANDGNSVDPTAAGQGGIPDIGSGNGGTPGQAPGARTPGTTG